MKSLFFVVLIISVLSIATLAEQSSEQNIRYRNNYRHAEHHSRQQEVRQARKQHPRKALRMHSLTANDVYDEIKKLQQADEVKLQQLESQRTQLISQRSTLQVQYESEKNKTTSSLLLLQNATFTLEQFISTKTTQENLRITIEKEISKIEQSRTVEESNLKELNTAQNRRDSNVQQIKSDISKKTEEIERLKQQLIKAENDKKDLETQLTNEINQRNSNQDQITKQQVKITEIGGCLKKEQTTREKIIIEITRITTEITRYTKIKQELDTLYQFQLTSSNNLKKQIDDLSRQIESIQAQIADLKMRICSYFDKNKSQASQVQDKQTNEQPASQNSTSAGVAAQAQIKNVINKASVEVEKSTSQTVKQTVGGQQSALVAKQKNLSPSAPN